jgi:hypothetical protein
MVEYLKVNQARIHYVMNVEIHMYIEMQEVGNKIDVESEVVDQIIVLESMVQSEEEGLIIYLEIIGLHQEVVVAIFGWFGWCFI